MPVKQSAPLIEWVRRHGVTPPPEVELGTVEQPVTIVRDDRSLVRPLAAAIAMVEGGIGSVGAGRHGALSVQPRSAGGAWLLLYGSFASVIQEPNLLITETNPIDANQAVRTPLTVPGRDVNGLVPAAGANCEMGTTPAAALGAGESFAWRMQSAGLPFAFTEPLWIPPGWFVSVVNNVDNASFQASLLWREIP